MGRLIISILKLFYSVLLYEKFNCSDARDYGCICRLQLLNANKIGPCKDLNCTILFLSVTLSFFLSLSTVVCSAHKLNLRKQQHERLSPLYRITRSDSVFASAENQYPPVLYYYYSSSVAPRSTIKIRILHADSVRRNLLNELLVFPLS